MPELLAAPPGEPVVLAEGEKAADALAAAGILAVATVTGANVTPSDDTLKPLVGRSVYLWPDHDDPGRQHMQRIAAALDRLGGAPRIVRWADASAPGADAADYLAGGGTADGVRQLLTMAQAAEKTPADAGSDPEHPYSMTSAGIFRVRMTREGEVIDRLTNFEARIVEDVLIDDGLGEPRRELTVEANYAGRCRRLRVPARFFPTMGWVAEHLESGALVMPGIQTRDHARAAIQFLSAPLCREVYSHSGFRQLQGRQWVFLDSGGAIGTAGRVADVEVELPRVLQPMLLEVPENADAACDALRASLALLTIGPMCVMAPLLAATFRPVIGEVDCSLFITGKTGVFKSELAALAQSHFGRGFDARHLPANWTSTENSLEDLACSAKDVLLTIDDFIATSGEMARLHARAERVLRAQGNHQGRQRMRADGTLRPERPPRGMILSTGEDVPRGSSLRARALIVEVAPNAIPKASLTDAQRQAESGVFAQAMGAYVQWLAPRLDEVRAGLRTEVRELRDQAARIGQHARTPDLAANLALGLRWVLKCALDLRAITKEEEERTWQECWEAILTAAAEQGEYHRQEDPAERFLQLLGAALASGRAHLAARTGLRPADPARWGWRQVGPGGDWQGLGERIGWVDGEGVYLLGDAAFACVQEFAQDQRNPIGITLPTLRSRLRDAGFLLVEREGTRTRLERRVTVEGVRLRVTHLHLGSLTCDPVGQVGQPATNPATALVGNGPLPGPFSGNGDSVGHGVGRSVRSNGAGCKLPGPPDPLPDTRETPPAVGAGDSDVHRLPASAAGCPPCPESQALGAVVAQEAKVGPGDDLDPCPLWFAPDDPERLGLWAELNLDSRAAQRRAHSYLNGVEGGERPAVGYEGCEQPIEPEPTTTTSGLPASATANLTPAWRSLCRMCGRRRSWCTTNGGPLVCATCHPPAPGLQVVWDGDPEAPTPQSQASSDDRALPPGTQTERVTDGPMP
ncbi:MAG: DUF927 domain-containing protein [Planctomycetes bacterium]|nr:DUF927 domain-containing protein [Planctomycetota bacterium]